MTTTASTVAVVSTWAVVSALVWGCGYAVRLLVLRLVALDARAAPCVADVWTGLAALTVYLVVWSLGSGIDRRTWLPVVLVGLLGWGLALRHRPARLLRPPTAIAAVVLVLVAWVANLSLGETTAYDSGLYHLAVIDGAMHGAVVPGLGNLHIRLSSDAAHLLLVAFLGVGPWRGAGQHVANGLLLSLLFLQLGVLLTARVRGARDALSGRVSLLLLPGVALLVAVDPAGRVSSPSLDVPCLVLVVAGGVLLTRAVELAHDGRYLVAAGAAFGTAFATRPQVAPAIVVAVVLLAARDAWHQRVARSLAFGILPASCLVAAAARQSVLSGYPFFPLSWPALRVDWRLDAAAVDRYRETVEAWARRPGDLTSGGLRDWSWLGDWARTVATDSDIAVVLGLALVAPVVSLLAGRRVAARVGRVELIALLAPAAAMVAFWFLTAPDTRFAYGAILLLGLGEVAWLTSGVRGAPVAAALVLVASALVVLARNDAWLVEARGGGPLGTPQIPPPETRSFVTDSGLVVQTPVDGERCFAVPLCTPGPDARLELRGRTPAQGFRLRPATPGP